MRYCIVTSGIIENIVIAEADVAEKMGFLPWYDEAKIGDTYNPPPEPEPEPTEVEILQAQVAELQAELLRIRTGG